MSRRSERREIDKAARAASRSRRDQASPADAAVPETAPDAAGRVPRSPRRAEVGGDRGLRVWRWPILVLLPLLVVAGVVVDRTEETTPDHMTGGELAVPLVPVFADPSAPGSTWYCAAGTATGVRGEVGAGSPDDQAGSPDEEGTDADEGADPESGPGAAEQTIVIANQAEVDRTGTVTVFPEGGTPVAVPIEVGARSRHTLIVSDVVRAAHAAAVVELDGGGVTVEHKLAGPAGSSVSFCSTAPSDSWVFPVGTTRPGTTLDLTLFNPFPGEAVVDITALSDDGTREPEAYQGLVVPSQGVITLPLHEVITLRAQVTTVVRVRSGRVVGEIVQTADGTIIDDGEGQVDPQYAPTVAAGLTAMLGAPGPAFAWVYPNGTTSEQLDERFVVYNPSEETAEVEVQVILDDPATNGIAEPFQIALEPRSHRSVVLFGTPDTRVPPGVGHSVVVRSVNEVPVVSARAIWSTAEEDPAGLTFTLGSPLVATRWASATSSLAGQAGASVTVFNPSPDVAVDMSIRVIGGGSDEPVTEDGSFTIGPNERRAVLIPGDGWGVDASSFVVVADLPVVVENHYRFGEGGRDLSFFMLAPQVGTTSPAPATTGTLSTDYLLGS